ncbi:MAG: hypothetical protein MUQ57_00085, partial [Porticoccus sp.]|nr:hypothetical protein [Porticoccus sp.]
MTLIDKICDWLLSCSRQFRSKQLSRCFNVDDLRKVAKRRLPASLFGYIDGGSDDERTLRG